MHYLLKVLFPWVLTFYFLNIFLIYIFLIFSSGDFMCFQTKSSWDFIVSWKIGYDGKRRICVLQCGIVHQVSVTMCKHLSLQFMKFFNVTLLYNFWESVGNYYFWMLRVIEFEFGNLKFSPWNNEINDQKPSRTHNFNQEAFSNNWMQPPTHRGRATIWSKALETKRFKK